MVFVYYGIVESKVLGGAAVTSSELGLEIEAAYAAPESINIVHEVRFVDGGYPAIGSLLINHEDRKICTHQYDEDLMFMGIMNAGFTAAALGKLEKEMWIHREGIIAGLKKAKAAIHYMRPKTWIKAGAKKLVPNFAKKTAGKTGVVKRTMTSALRKSGRFVAKWVGKGFKAIGRGIAKIIGEKAASKIVTAFSKTKFFITAAGKIVKAFFKGVGGYIVGRVSTQEIQANTEFTLDTAPDPTGASKVVAKVVAAVGTGLDFYYIIVPMLRMVDAGHEASDDMLEEMDCYNYVSKDKSMYVGPPNCDAKVKFAEIDISDIKVWGLPVGSAAELYIKIYPRVAIKYWAIRGASAAAGHELDLTEPPVFPISKPILDEPIGPPAKMELIGDECSDTPNAMISYNSPFAEMNEFTNSLGVGVLRPEGHRASKWRSQAFFTAPYAVCSLIENAPGATARGTRCKQGLLLVWASLYYAWPKQFFSMLWGSNILPSEEYYYMRYPLYININKNYNQVSGESKLMVEKIV